MNQVATMLTNLLSNRKSLETLQSYKKYCDPVVDDWDEEILSIEENTPAVDLPSLYEKYCSDNQELSIIDTSESTACSYESGQHESDDLQVYRTDRESEDEDEYQEDFDEGESSSSRHSRSGQSEGERRSGHNQHNAGRCDEMYVHSEASHLSELEDGEDDDYDEDWVEDGQEELDEAFESASLCLSTASSCTASSSSSKSRMREERTQKIHYPQPPRQLTHLSSPPPHVTASMKRKNPNKTQPRPSYLTIRSPYLDFSSSTEFILLSRRPCYRQSTQTIQGGKRVCPAVRCVTNPGESAQAQTHSKDRLSNSVYVRACLTSTAAAARTLTHSPRRDSRVESPPSPSTVGHIYNSGKLGYLKKSISEFTNDNEMPHQTSSRRKIEDTLRRQVIDLVTLRKVFLSYKLLIILQLS